MNERVREPGEEKPKMNRAMWWQSLLDPDAKTRRWGVAETIVMLAWLGAAAFAIAQHTPWADEEQAWMLAAGVSWKTLFVHSLHYEGTGGLWHALLKLLQAFHIPFTGMRWIVGAIQGGAIAVLLRYAPFPRLVRWLLPFTFFLVYQDAVIARSYCLFAILAFPAVVLLRRASPRPVLFALLLGLLANDSVHAAVASAGLAIAACFLWRGRFLKSVPAVALLLLLWVGAAATMVPAPDVDYSAASNIQRSLAKLKQQAGLHGAATGNASAAPAPEAAAPEPAALGPVRHGFAKTWHRIVRILAVFTYPLSVYRPLALLVVVLVTVQAFGQGRKLQRSVSQDDAGSTGAFGLVPYYLVALVFSSLYLAPRHAGTVFTSFVVSAWLTWPQAAPLDGRRRQLQRVCAGALALAALVQVSWSFHAIREEHTQPYAPGAMTAKYLQSRGVGAPGAQSRVAGFYYYSVDPLLYFDHNIYFNQPPHRYWYWSTVMRTYGTLDEALAKKPEYIVIGGFESGHDAEITRDWEPVPPAEAGVSLHDHFHIARFFEERGYHVTHVFCGHSWMRSTYAESLCNELLEPDAAPQAISKPE